MHTQEGRRASQRALGAAQSCLRGYRDESKGEFAPASRTRATLGREGESRHPGKPRSPRSAAHACVGLSARAGWPGWPRGYLGHSSPPAGPLGSLGSEKH